MSCSVSLAVREICWQCERDSFCYFDSLVHLTFSKIICGKSVTVNFTLVPGKYFVNMLMTDVRMERRDDPFSPSATI